MYASLAMARAAGARRPCAMSRNVQLLQPLRLLCLWWCTRLQRLESLGNMPRRIDASPREHRDPTLMDQTPEWSSTDIFRRHQSLYPHSVMFHTPKRIQAQGVGATKSCHPLRFANPARLATPLNRRCGSHSQRSTTDRPPRACISLPRHSLPTLHLDGLTRLHRETPPRRNSLSTSPNRPRRASA